MGPKGKEDREITEQLQMPFKQLYFDKMRQVLGRHFGPFNIFCCSWTTLRFASIRPLDVDMAAIFLHRHFDND